MIKKIKALFLLGIVLLAAYPLKDIFFHSLFSSLSLSLTTSQNGVISFFSKHVRRNITSNYLRVFLDEKNLRENYKVSFKKLFKINFTYDAELLPKQNETVGNIIFFNNITCKAIHPRVLLYNRIFKTGSSTIEELLTRMSAELRFTLHKFTTEDWYNTGDSFPYPEVIEYKTAKAYNLTAFVAHFFFRKLLRINKQHTYINLLRNPVDRVVSHYYYMRNEKLRRQFRIQELKQSGQFNESLLDCVQNQHRGCEDNVMTRFFCGPNTYCKTGSFKALKKAKYNMAHHYAVVGTLENFNLFLKVIKMRLPSFFNYASYAKELPRIKENNISVKTSPFILELIRNRNRADTLLYEFAKKRFLKQWDICKKSRFEDAF